MVMSLKSGTKPVPGALALAVGAALWAAPSVTAQMHQSSVGINGGAVLYSAFNAGSEAGEDLKPDPSTGFFGGIQYDWFVGGGNLGFRLAAHYQQMKLPWNGQNRTIYTYVGDFDVILRPIAPNPDTRVIPFVSVGIGGTRYRLGKGNPTAFDGANAIYSGREKTGFSMLGGIGFDFVTGWGWDEGPFLIRLEAQDNYVLDSPLDPLEGTSDFNGIHNIRVSLGLHNSMGLLR